MNESIQEIRLSHINALNLLKEICKTAKESTQLAKTIALNEDCYSQAFIAQEQQQIEEVGIVLDALQQKKTPVNKRPKTRDRRYENARKDRVYCIISLGSLQFNYTQS